MPADWLEVTVRSLHILFGTFWVGSILYQHIVLATFKRLPPPTAGPAMLALGKRGVPIVLSAGILTVLFGIWNQYLAYGELAYRGATANVALGVALVGSLAILGLGVGVQLPTLRRMEALAPKGPPPAGAPPAGPPPEVMKLRARMGMLLMVVTVLALVIIASMVVATLARTQGW